MTETATAGICGSANGITGNRCQLKPGHKGMHRGAGGGQWGGKTTWKPPASSYRPIKLKTVEEQRVPYRPPAAPRFENIPGQQAMDLFSDAPGSAAVNSAIAKPPSKL